MRHPKASPQSSSAARRRTVALALSVFVGFLAPHFPAAAQSPAEQAEQLEQEASGLASENKFKDAIAAAQKALAIREAATPLVVFAVRVVDLQFR
jgi:hypothetical protein